MKQEWDSHWKKLGNDTFGKICTFYRVSIISNAVAFFIEKYFPKEGIFVECGSGTSQSSVKIKKHKRKIIALDISMNALKEAAKISQNDFLVNADIFRMPFKNNSIRGIWNLGVMEHFRKEEIKLIMKEFSRVLKPGSYALLFWPPLYGHYHFSTSAIEFVSRKLLKKKVDLFPDEVSLFSGKIRINEIAKKAGFSKCEIFYTPRDLFTYAIVACRK